MTGKCECATAGYYPAPQGCTGCNIIGCLTCSSDTACATCKSTFNFTTPIVDDHCSCLTGSYYNTGSQICSVCQNGCLDCTESATCVTCDASNFFEKSSANICVCQKGYFLNITNNC